MCFTQVDKGARKGWLSCCWYLLICAYSESPATQIPASLQLAFISFACPSIHMSTKVRPPKLAFLSPGTRIAPVLIRIG